MKIYLCLVGLLFYSAVLGQKRFIICAKANSKLPMKPSRIVDSTKIDTGILDAAYRYDYTRYGQPRFTIFRMQAGSRWVKHTCMPLYASSRYNELFFAGTDSRVLDSIRQAKQAYGHIYANLFAELYEDRASNTWTVLCSSYITRMYANRYEEPRPAIEWRLLDGDSLVCGYRCHAATCDFRGRRWRVWYAPDVPISGGPWKLCGLPGLILRAETPGHTFQCVRLAASQLPIFRTEYRSERDFKTRARYMRYERLCFEHPYEAILQDGDADVVITEPGGKWFLCDASTDWFFPYDDPLETAE